MIDHDLFLAVIFLGNVLKKLEPSIDWSEFNNSIKSAYNNQVTLEKDMDNLLDTFQKIKSLKD